MSQVWRRCTSEAEPSLNAAPRRRTRRTPQPERRLFAERLEPRNLLAAVSLVDGNLVIADSPGAINDNLTVFANASDERYEVSDFANMVTTSIPGATGSGTPTVHVPFAAVTGSQLLVAFQGGNDTTNIRGDFPVTVAIDGGAGIDNINFNGDLSTVAGRSLTATVETIDVFSSTDIVTSDSGAISLSATSIVLSGSLASTSTIALTADSLLINPTATIASAADVALRTLTSNRGVLLGGEDAGRLSLTDDELDRITAGTIRVTDTAASGVRFTNPITYDNHLEILTLGPGETLIEAAVTMAPNKNFTVLQSTLSPGNANIRLIGSNSRITTSGSGAISLTAQAAFHMAGSLTTENGGITVIAHGAGAIFPPNSVDIGMGAVVSSTGTGNISITGLSTTGLQGGLRVLGTIQSTSATNAPAQGRIRIEGESGTNGGAGTNIGGAIVSNGGDIEIVGRGGTGASPIGVTLEGGQIEASGAASISLAGAGGDGSQIANGVQIHRGGRITSQSGDIQIHGTGGATTSVQTSIGVTIGAPSGQGYVTSSSGDILIQGAGGDGPSVNHGVFVNNVASAPFSSELRTSAGSILIEGTAGSGAATYATSILAQSQPFIVVPDGDLTIIGDSFEKAGGGFMAAISGGNLTFAPKTTGVPVSVGGADVLTGSKVLGLSDSDLAGSSAPRFIIGSSTSGSLSVDANITPYSGADYERNMDLLSGGDIVFNARLSTLDASGVRTRGAVLLSPGETGTIKVPFTGQDVVTSNASSTFATSLAPSATLAINIGGTTVDTQYHRLSASGAVNLAGANLVLTGGFVTSLGQAFTIVSAASVTGQFNGLPENCALVHNGRSLRVNYTPTAVTLTDVGQPPTLAAAAAAVSVDEGSLATNTGTFNDPDGNATATVTASIGSVVQDNVAGTWSWSLPTTNGPAGPVMVSITVTDPWCAMDVAIFEFTVANIAPAVTSLLASTDAIAQGETVSFSGAFADPGDDVWQATATIQRAGAPDVIVQAALNPDKTFGLSHMFTTAGLHTVIVVVADGDPGTPTSRMVQVDVIAPPELPGDYDVDHDVDGTDYLLWQRQLGTATLPYTAADGDGNRVVAEGDLEVWRANYGVTGSPIGAGAVPVTESAVRWAFPTGPFDFRLAATGICEDRQATAARVGGAEVRAALAVGTAPATRAAYFDSVALAEGGGRAFAVRRGPASLRNLSEVDDELLQMLAERVTSLKTAGLRREPAAG